MNLYEKYHLAKVAIASAHLKKSGKNTYAGYDYYELGDILPAIIKACAEYKITCMVSFYECRADLTIVDMEKPEDKIVFTSPMSTANLKGCHPVQNLGAVQSYIRRYLYMAAFEITDGDALDATQGKEDRRMPQPSAQPRKQVAPNPKPAEDRSRYISKEQMVKLWDKAVTVYGKETATEWANDLNKKLGISRLNDIRKDDLDAAYNFITEWGA